MTLPKPASDVPPDQTDKGDVEPVGLTGLPIEDQAVQDILFNDMVGEKKEEKPTEAAVEAEPVEAVADAETPIEAKVEEKPTEPPVPDDTEYFAKIGDRAFKTKDDLIAYTSSQNGLNRAVIGNLKKIHPEWFDDKGAIKPDRMKQVKVATEVVPPAGDETKVTPPMSETEKDKLRAIGIVFKEDIAPVMERYQKEEDDELATWQTSHPGAQEHMEEITALVEATATLPEDQQMDPDQAWKVVQGRHGLAPDPSTKTYEQGLIDGQKKASLDTIAVPPARSSGGGDVPIRKVEGDIIDQALAAPHIF